MVLKQLPVALAVLAWTPNAAAEVPPFRLGMAFQLDVPELAHPTFQSFQRRPPALHYACPTLVELGVELGPLAFLLEGPSASSAPWFVAEISEPKQQRLAWVGEAAARADLLIPGSDEVAVRLVPTTKRLPGQSSSIVLLPRVAGVWSSFYGLNVATSF